MTMLIRPLLPLFLLYCFLPDVPAQDYLPVARYFGIEDGLPHRQVNCILQDRQGFIWVATEGGVGRFDGLRFKIFNKADNGLSTDIVSWMLEDAAGNLWLISANFSGDSFQAIRSVDILHPVSGRITPLDQYIKEKPPVPLESMHALGILQISDGTSLDPSKPGTLFFGTFNPGGWVSWHPDQGWNRVMAPSLPNLEILTRTPQNGVLGLTQDALHTHQIFVELDARGNVLRYFEGAAGNKFHRLFGNAKNPERYFALEEDKGSGQPIYWEIKAGADKTRLALPLPKLRGPLWERMLLLELEQGNLWLTEHDIFNHKGETLLDLLAQFPAINNRSTTIYSRDRNGGTWLGSTYGLEYIKVRKDFFRRFLYDKNARDGGGGYPCRGMLQAGDTLWVNTEGGLGKGGLCGIDLATGRVFFEQKIGPNHGLASDAAGNMWSGQSHWSVSDLARVDLVSGQVLDTFAFAFEPTIIWAFFPAKPDQLWCGTFQGLAFFNTTTKQVSYPDTDNFPELKAANIYHIGRDRSGGIWLCSSTGFYKMTDEGQIAGRYWSNGKDEHWLPYDNLHHFYQDTEGVFWLGTAGGGLLRWDTKTGKKRLLSRTSGLLNNVVYAVYEDDYEHLWLPTDLGIAQFDKKTLSVRRTWVTGDGITQNEFNRTSHFKGADGTLYFGGMNGVTAFHPKDFYGTNPEPGAVNAQPGTQARNTEKTLALSDFKLFSGASKKLENRTADLLASGRVTMKPADRYFQLEFALLDYFLSPKVTYFYKIEGIDADWNLLPEALLRLSGLPYGTHRLKIRAESADGTRAENELDYQLTVLRPFYLRWWFLLLAAVAVLWGGFYFYRFQLNRGLAAKETERLQQLDAFKTRFYTNISHEFRTPLTVILGMVESLKFDTGQKREKSAEMVRRNSRKLLNLVNQLLDLSRLESGKLQVSPSNGDLAAYLRFQLESFHSYAQTRGISLHFSSELPHLPMAFDHDKIQTILANLISNALKFTPEGGQITLALHTIPPSDAQHPSQVVLELSDTGVGIPQDQLDRIFDRFYQVDGLSTRKGEGSGIGLALVQELVKLMQGSITVDSTPGQGTAFRVTLPFTPPTAQLQPYAGANTLATDFPIPVGEAQVDALAHDDQRPLLLIVEDNPDVRFYITECVREEYRVALAGNGAEGIHQAQELVPDIIISDVMMPEKDGYELCDTLKNDERTSHIPIILLTAKADNASKIAGLLRGADAYLAKPFDVEELLVRLKMLVERQKRMIAYFSKKAGTEPDAATPEQKEAYDIEHAFIGKMRKIIEENFADENFALPQLCEALNMSRSQLFRKLKALVNIPPSDFIRTYRLQKAKLLLETGDLTVSEVAWQVGYKDVSHFSRSFHELFGFSPGQRGK
jgi:signal transduction histidine kinase/DNA-binding response OmpR family regulator/ligand-binding sensor domain-containing protein